MTNTMELFSEMERSVVDGNQQQAAALAQQALAAGVPPLEAIERGYLRGIRRAGQLWEEGEFFLPELVTAAQAMKAAMVVLQPALAQTQDSSRSAGRVVIGTVQGDIHDIGKTLVGTMMAANGFQVSDEGADVPVSRFVRRARELDADLVCASALLTTTMVVQRELVQALKEAGLRARVLVGGAPVNGKWADQIGAHGFADNAVAAVKVARSLVGQ
jgi:corrinoid protein of di/trimethylamine methyltransferase